MRSSSKRIISAILIIAVLGWIAPARAANPDDDDGFWSALLGKITGKAAARLVGLAIGGVIGAAIVKTVILAVTHSTQEQRGHASIKTLIVDIVVDDIDGIGTTEGEAFPTGFASATVTGTGALRLENVSADAILITATVSPMSGAEFMVSAGASSESASEPPQGGGSAFVDFKFGVADPNNPSTFMDSPLFDFHREMTDGTLSGSIPEQSFPFTLEPGGSMTLLTQFEVGGQASAVPEPSTWLMFGTGFLVLLGYGWRRKKRAA